MKNRPIIFLDIDGVLRPFEQEHGLSHSCVRHLNELVSRTGADVVLTSSWRSMMSLGAIGAELEEAGFQHRLAEATPILPGRSRGTEISAFLDGCGQASFVILDDDCDVEEELREHLILVDDAIGLQARDVERAVAWLTSG